MERWAVYSVPAFVSGQSFSDLVGAIFCQNGTEFSHFVWREMSIYFWPPPDPVTGPFTSPQRLVPATSEAQGWNISLLRIQIRNQDLKFGFMYTYFRTRL